MMSCLTNAELLSALFLLFLRSLVFVLLAVYGSYQLRKIVSGSNTIPRFIILLGIALYIYSISRIAFLDTSTCHLLSPITFGFNVGIILIIAGLITLSRAYNSGRVKAKFIESFK